MGEETPVQNAEELPQTEVSVQEGAKPSTEVDAIIHNLASTAIAADVAQETQPEVTATVPQAFTGTGITYEKRADGLPEFMYDAVAWIAPQQGFTPGHFQIKFEAGSGKGDGFVAEMFRASIIEGDRKLVVLCKIPPINDARRQSFESMPIFDREVQAYSNFLPAMYEFQRSKGITEEMGIGFFNAPKSYLAYIDRAKEESVIIMEDLRLKDYRMWNKLAPVNYEHARLLMVQLGRLHAVSFAMKEQQPNVFEQFKVSDPMTTMMMANDGFAQMMQMSLDRVLTTLEPREDRERQKLQKLKDTIFDELKTLTSSEIAEPYAVLAHGDCWINNTIFSYKRGKPTDIVLLDWQICRYVSPALDLLYFIFCCTDEDFRRQHYDEMIRIYYDSLKQLLEKLGGDPTRQFPYTALLRQLKLCGKFAIFMSMFLIPMLCIENQDLPDMDEVAEKFKESQQIELPFDVTAKTEAKYKKRMGAVVRDLIRYGYL